MFERLNPADIIQRDPGINEAGGQDSNSKENSGPSPKKERSPDIRTLLKKLEEEKGPFPYEFAEQIINKNKAKFVASYIKKFQVSAHAQIAEKLTHGDIYALLGNFNEFKINHTEVACKMIKDHASPGHGAEYMLHYLKDSKKIDFKKIIDALIEKDMGFDTAHSVKNFPESVHEYAAEKCLTAGRGNIVMLRFNDYKIDKKSYVKKLLDLGNKVTNEDIVSQMPYLLKGVITPQEIADKFLEKGEPWWVLDNPDKFRGIDQNEFAKKLIIGGHISLLKQSLDKLKNLEQALIDFIKTTGDKQDFGDVYKYNQTLPYSEIEEKYNELRVGVWQQPGVLEEEDKKALEELQKIADRKNIGELWDGAPKTALHIVGPEIMKMLRISGYTEETFRGEYIERLIKDNSTYQHGHRQTNSLLHFQQTTQNLYEPDLQSDVENTFTEASSFEETRALVSKLKEEGPFKNWETLKKYYDLSELLKKKDVLKKLQTLKEQGKEKQYAFFSALAFYPDSKISMQTVFQFMEDPKRFLDVEDQHSGRTHERKKPSNYTQFDYLDITAEDLRDALIEGTLDKLQYFKPFEAQYKIPLSNKSDAEMVGLLRGALGSRSENIQGNAKNPGKLFKEISEILKKNNTNYENLLADPSLLTGQLQIDIETALFNQNYGIKDDRKFESYAVKIHPKSSPEGLLAGNDTACCMPFGSGKNNVYMYNLGCAMLTVQRKVGDRYRTIAQSVLTPDIDIKHSIPDLVQGVESEAVLSSVIKEDLSQKKEVILTADNIEVGPNASKYKETIELIYQDFLAKYVQEAAKKHAMDTSRILIGKGYNDLPFKNTVDIPNTYVPITPVAYSDNYGSQVFQLKFDSIKKVVPEPNYITTPEQIENKITPELPKGVSLLTADETLRVSYMEGKVYADNESLIQYIHRIGNELTAKDINNEMKNRPNISLKIEDEKGALLGYLIAYEGTDPDNNNKPILYISDIAADTKKSMLAGGRLIKAFGDLINREYLSKGRLIPIVAQARESTSYKLIKDHLSELGKEYGYTFKLSEGGTERRRNDTMHSVTLTPVKT